jgi:general stress protein YciG
MEKNGKSRKGFAAMDPAKVREISSRGGKAAHAQGKAHQFTTEEAREAGRKGGRAVHAKLRAAKKQVEMFDPTGDAALAPEGIES